MNKKIIAVLGSLLMALALCAVASNHKPVIVTGNPPPKVDDAPVLVSQFVDEGGNLHQNWRPANYNPVRPELVYPTNFIIYKIIGTEGYYSWTLSPSWPCIAFNWA